MRTPYFNRIIAGSFGFSPKGCAVLGFLLFTSLSLSAQNAPNPTVALIVQSASVTEDTGSTIVIEITISAAQPKAQVFGFLMRGSDIVREDFVNQPQNIEIGAIKQIF